MKHSYLKTRVTQVETVVDSSTGEVLDVNIKKHSFIANSKETFFIGYSALIGAFMEMNQAEVRIFGYCLRYAKGIQFDITKKIRLDISKHTGLNERTIHNNIPLLLEKGLLFKHESGLYQINPRYAYQGSTSERNDALKAIIELGCEEC